MDSQPIVGGTGKGASGAASIIGDNGTSGANLNPLLVGVVAVAALAVLGWLIVTLTKK